MGLFPFPLLPMNEGLIRFAAGAVYFANRPLPLLPMGVMLGVGACALGVILNFRRLALSFGAIIVGVIALLPFPYPLLWLTTPLDPPLFKRGKRDGGIVGFHATLYAPTGIIVTTSFLDFAKAD